jgi:hypothetical protein
MLPPCSCPDTNEFPQEVTDLVQIASTGSRPLRGWAPSPTSGLITDEKYSIVADLTQRLGPQVLSVDKAIGSLGPAHNESMEFVSRTRQGAMGGYVVELSSTTPLSSGLEEAWRSLAAFIGGVQAEDVYHNSEVSSSTPTSHNSRILTYWLYVCSRVFPETNNQQAHL